MALTLAATLALAAQCAPGVAPDVMLSMMHVESHFDQYAIGINHGPVVHPRTFDEAVNTASRYIAAGYSVDLGIAQINSHNLSRLGLAIADTFDPCTSMRAGQKLLLENYSRARQSASGDDAIGLAMSYYNSGSPTRGYNNGYVGKIFKAAAYVTPAVRDLLSDPNLLANAPETMPDGQSALQWQAPLVAAPSRVSLAILPAVSQPWLVTVGQGKSPSTISVGVSVFK